MIGRAGTGVDNVDVEAATKRGIVVANAPEANSIAAAEHTLALMLALCRNVPEAHASLAGGKWDRGSFKGSELYGKTLGVLGFGRIGQLVAARARAFEMRVIAYDKFVTAERFRELGAEGVDDPDELFARADFISLHLRRRRRPSASSTKNRSRGCARASGSSTARAASWSIWTPCSPASSRARSRGRPSTSSPKSPSRGTRSPTAATLW